VPLERLEHRRDLIGTQDHDLLDLERRRSLDHGDVLRDQAVLQGSGEYLAEQAVGVADRPRAEARLECDVPLLNIERGQPL
jgi:hypothetical protein